MDYSELLHNYIEGGIEAREEEQLFSVLAENPNLRIEFKHFIDFEKAAKSDIAAFIPPVESTAGIFSSLGVSPIAAGSSIGVAAVQTGFWSKYGLMLFTNVLTLLLTGALSYFLFTSMQNNSSNINKSNLSLNGNTQSNQLLSTDKNNNQGIPFVSNSENASVNSRTAKSKRNHGNKMNFRYVTVKGESIKDNKPSNNNITSIENENSDISLNEDNSSNVVLLSKTLDLSDKDFKYQNNNNFFSPNKDLNKFGNKNKINLSDFPLTFSFLELNDISLIMSGIETWSIPGATVAQSTQPFMRNASILALYDLNKDLSFGIDFRQEFFFQSYTGVDKDNISYKYEQNTNYLALGLVAKYKFLDTKYFKPFGQIYFGGNKVGLIGRAMFGVEIAPGKDYGFILGLEGSALRYSHLNDYFYSKKIGAYYGVIFHI